MSIQEIRLDKSDVTLEKIDEPCECEEAQVSTTVFVDYRSAGLKVSVGRYCRKCAEETYEYIRKGLPDEEGVLPVKEKRNG